MKENCIGLGKKTIIGMVHCLPLPKTAPFNDNCEQIIQQAVQDARNLETAHCDAVCIENMGDTPLSITMETAQIAALSAISAIIRREISLPIGIDAAFNDYKASLAIAKILNADFVRIPVFVDTVMYFGGTIHPVACECMKYRKDLQAEHIKILADIQVKYTQMLLPSISLEESAKMAVTCGADALIVTGKTSGSETPIESIQKIKKIVPVPIIAGSGVNKENIREQLNIADGAIIGSSLKKNSLISNPIDMELAKEVVNAVKKEKSS